MKLRLSSSGHTEDSKEFKKISHGLNILKESVYGYNYHSISLDRYSDTVLLLNQYSSHEKIKNYFFKDTLYITKKTEKYHYIINMNDTQFSTLKQQIQYDKKILFSILNYSQEIEYLILQDIII